MRIALRMLGRYRTVGSNGMQTNYEATARILSFNVNGIPRDAGRAPSNPPIDTILAAAIRLVCRDKWRDAGNVFAVILRDEGPPILDMAQARAMMSASDFPHP